MTGSDFTTFTMCTSGEDRPVTSPASSLITSPGRHDTPSTPTNKSLAFSIASIMGSQECRHMVSSPEAPKSSDRRGSSPPGIPSPARGRTAESPTTRDRALSPGENQVIIGGIARVVSPASEETAARVPSQAGRQAGKAGEVEAHHSHQAPIIPIPTHAAAAQYYHNMTMLAEAQRRNAIMAQAAGADAQAQKEMLELSARYMSYLHPAFLMGRMSEYHTQQLLRNYPSYLAQQQQAQSQAHQAHTQAQQAAREYLMRADQPGFEPGSKLSHTGYNRLAQAYAQATLQNRPQHAVSGVKKSNSSENIITSRQMEIDDDEINVIDTDLDSLKNR